jgi:hypothetical protein
MTTTHSGARLRAVQAAGVAAAVLSLPAAAAGNVAEGERDGGASLLAGETVLPRDRPLRAPIAGHATVAGQMRAAARSYEQRRLMRVADLLTGRVPEAEQDMRAARLYARAGATPWPICGR